MKNLLLIDDQPISSYLVRLFSFCFSKDSNPGILLRRSLGKYSQLTGSMKNVTDLGSAGGVSYRDMMARACDNQMWRSISGCLNGAQLSKDFCQDFICKIFY